MARLSKRQSIWILVGIIVAIGGAVGWFWIWPSIQYINTNVAELQQQRAEIEHLEQRREVDPEEDLAPYTDSLETLQAAQVTEENLIRVIETIENVAGASGVEYQLSVEGEEDDDGSSVSANKPPDQKDPTTEGEEEVTKIELKLIAGGSFPQLIEVLKKIENLPSVVNITVLNIEKRAEATGEDLENITTSIRGTYSLTIPLSN